MDFKTFKIKTFMRKYEHDDLVMVGGLLAIIGLVIFNLVTYGVHDSYYFAF